MFSHLCVILFTGESLSKHASQVGFLSGGLCPGGLCPGGLHPGGSLCRGVCLRVLCPGGTVRGDSVLGVFLRETPHMVKSGQYASYWNAFLFLNYFRFFDMKETQT